MRGNTRRRCSYRAQRGYGRELPCAELVGRAGLVIGESLRQVTRLLGDEVERARGSLRIRPLAIEAVLYEFAGCIEEWQQRCDLGGAIFGLSVARS